MSIILVSSSGVVRETAYPLRCSECALEIASEHVLTTPRLGWRLPGVALLLFTVAYCPAIWPEIRQDGWTRLVPSTVLVLQPMDVTAWTDVRLGPYRPLVRPLSPPDALVAANVRANAHTPRLRLPKKYSLRKLLVCSSRLDNQASPKTAAM